MTFDDRLQTHEHVLDVLRAALSFRETGEPVALAIITGTEGGAVRMPGAMMAVTASGRSAGYVSGGCIDADVRLNARQALAEGAIRALRYGAGSPFPDIRLPCGGAIEILILTALNSDDISALASPLAARRPVRLLDVAAGWPSPAEMASLPDITYLPKPALRIAGRGTDCLALARLAGAAGFQVRLQLADEEDMAAAHEAGLGRVSRLWTPTALSDVEDDPWTAFVLMFHDRDWEIPLLRQALEGPAFYIGAVGSRNTQAMRLQALREAGCPPGALERLRGPVGLIPGMRDASYLAISVLSEIIRDFMALREQADV